MEQTQDNVGARHPDYDAFYAHRKPYCDVIRGTAHMREMGIEYMPKFPAEIAEDYALRKQLATLFNVTKKTRDVMTGLIFKGDPELSEDVSPEIAPLWENIDNAGKHGAVFARDVFDATFEGYCLILVDAPPVAAPDRESELAAGLRPYWSLYKADSIWNWSYRINPISKAKELELLVLRETSNERTGVFTFTAVTRFRVFMLTETGVVYQLWREVINATTKKAEYILESQGILSRMTQIPAAIVRSLGDEPPLVEIAQKNIEHWQTYSDYKMLIHKTCVPMLKILGESAEDASTKVVGASVAWSIENPAGDVGFAEIEGKSLETVRQSLLDNREEMALMGLALLADKTAKIDVTATEALLNNIGETAELRVMARALQDALELAAGFTAQYLGQKPVEGGSIELQPIWSGTSDDETAELDLLDKRATIANKLLDIFPRSWLVKFMGATDEDEFEQVMKDIASVDMVTFENEQPTTEESI
ncbi:MAG: DUF4055 domain-containing protein [Acidobacteria bacterium]|nr:DUF4055 domain-containing protein [Acidobacteriota bacterium]